MRQEMALFAAVVDTAGRQNRPMVAAPQTMMWAVGAAFDDTLSDPTLTKEE